MSIVYDYNDYVTQLGEEDKRLNLYYLSGCWGAFDVGEKKMYARTSDGDFILPMMREAMNTIIADNTHLTERCEAIERNFPAGSDAICAERAILHTQREQNYGKLMVTKQW